MENEYARELSAKLKGLNYKQGFKLLKELNNSVEAKSVQWKVDYDEKPRCIFEVALGGDVKDNQNDCFILEQHEIFLVLYRIRIEDVEEREKEKFLELCPTDGEEKNYLYRLKSGEKWTYKEDNINDDIKHWFANSSGYFPNAKVEWDVIIPDEDFVPKIIPVLGMESKNPNNKFYRDGSNELMEYGQFRKALPLNSKKDLTDLDTIKKITIDVFVHNQPTATELGFVNHPILIDRHAFIRDKEVDVLTTDGFKEWEKNEAEIIKEKYNNPLTLIDHIRPLYRITYFKHIRKHLSEYDKGSLLNYAWKTCGTVSNNPNVSMDEMVSWFKEIDKYELMEEEDRKGLYEFPDMLTIYRGAKDADSLWGLCWTTDKEVAISFAKQPGDMEGQHLYKTEIKKKDILAYFDYENTVIIDPAILKKYRPEEIEIEEN